jgi:hypothetical protein
MEEEDIQRWLEATYGREVFRDATAKGVSLQPAWTQEDGLVTVHLQDGKLSHAQFAEIKNGPTFEQVVAGLGAPEVIIWDLHMYGGHVLYSFALHYPGLGVSVEGRREMTGSELSRPAEEWTGVLRKDTQVEWVDCYLPCSSVEETLADVFGLSPDHVQLRIKRQMPWPGFGGQVPLTVN